MKSVELLPLVIENNFFSPPCICPGLVMMLEAWLRSESQVPVVVLRISHVTANFQLLHGTQTFFLDFLTLKQISHLWFLTLLVKEVWKWKANLVILTPSCLALIPLSGISTTLILLNTSLFSLHKHTPNLSFDELSLFQREIGPIDFPPS